MKLQQIPLAKLKASDMNPRLVTNDSPGVMELADSIKSHGILVPLIVRAEKGSFRILAGHRRAVAAERAGLTAVPCVIRADTKIEAVEHLVENVVRLDLTPAETGAGVYAVLKAKKMKQQDLAAHLGKSPAWVSKFRTIGQAMEKFPDEKDLLGRYTNADMLYHVAQGLLDQTKTAKSKTTKGKTEDNEKDQTEFVTRDIEQRQTLLAAEIAEHLGQVFDSVKVKILGNDECNVTVLHKNEKEAKKFYCN